jgi:hypothetical protein
MNKMRVILLAVMFAAIATAMPAQEHSVHIKNRKALSLPATKPCVLIKNRRTLSSLETGGPFTLDHFKLTKGRMDLREFLWKHWRDRVTGMAEAKVGTIDAGTVTALYVVRPDENGNWGIDVELDRPLQPPCSAFRADSMVRLPIAKPDEDYPSQTLGFWPPDELPKKRVDDRDEIGPKFYQVQLVEAGKPAGDPI